MILFCKISLIKTIFFKKRKSLKYTHAHIYYAVLNSHAKVLDAQYAKLYWRLIKCEKKLESNSKNMFLFCMEQRFHIFKLINCVYMKRGSWIFIFLVSALMRKYAWCFRMKTERMMSANCVKLVLTYLDNQSAEKWALFSVVWNFFLFIYQINLLPILRIPKCRII